MLETFFFQSKENLEITEHNCFSLRCSTNHYSLAAFEMNETRYLKYLIGTNLIVRTSKSTLLINAGIFRAINYQL